MMADEKDYNAEQPDDEGTGMNEEASEAAATPAEHVEAKID